MPSDCSSFGCSRQSPVTSRLPPMLTEAGATGHVADWGKCFFFLFHLSSLVVKLPQLDSLGEAPWVLEVSLSYEAMFTYFGKERGRGWERAGGARGGRALVLGSVQWEPPS